MADTKIKTEDIIKEENKVFKRTSLLTDNIFHYCPGCGHGVAHRLIMEVVEEMGIQDMTIGIAPVGCSVLAYNYMTLTCTKQLTEERLLWLPESKEPCLTNMYSHTRAMATSLP